MVFKRKTLAPEARAALPEALRWPDDLPANMSPALWVAQTVGSWAGLNLMFSNMSRRELLALAYDHEFWLRGNQTPPDNAETTVNLGGRGGGKTHCGAAWAIKQAKRGRANGALIGPTAADVRDTMINGESGILALSPPWFYPKYEPSKRRLTWPNGVFSISYSADKPARLRGPNTGWVWGDEPATWKYQMAALDQVPLFNRIGDASNPPKLLLTGTPAPLKKLADLMEQPTTVVLRGSSLDNAAFLAPAAVRNMKAIAATRWGRQEVMGELLMDVPGALFGSARWGRIEVDPVEFSRGLTRRIVAVDPAPTSETGADESGIIVLGAQDEANGLRSVVVLSDASVRATPREWASAAIHEYVRFNCDALVVEVNTGGELTETLVRTVAEEMGIHVRVTSVRAREAKSKRAEPVSALAETGRIAFAGRFPKLEAQLERFTGHPGRRDDRADAFCWGIHELVFADQFFAIAV